MKFALSSRGHGRIWAGGVTLLAAALTAGGGLLVAGRRAARQAEAELERKDRERLALAARDPAPTADRAAAIEADLKRGAEALREVEGRLWRRDAPAPPAPASGTDAFFELAGFARAMGEQAARGGVGIKDGERFGFSAYTHDGPPAVVIPAIDRQRRMVAALLQALIAARPHRIDGVQREDPERRGIGDVRAGGGEGARSSDFFSIDPRLSLRAPGAVDTAAFRLAFTGDSQALRRLLNRLAASDTPAVVRSVAVEPAGDSPPRRPGRPGAGGSLALVVPAARSRFSVTVECCDVAGPGPGSSAAGRPAPEDAGEGGRWPEPVAQPRGREWVYDLFTPPAIYFDPRVPALHAAAPVEPAGGNPAETPPDLELLQVRRGPFRLQLIGYAEGPGDLRGILADAISGETVVARSGDRLSGQGVTIKRLVLDRPAATADGDTAAREPGAIALVAEDGAGTEVELTTREPCLAGAPVGLFASRRTTALRREAEAGESFDLDGVSYCVEQIDLQPPQALVACAPRDGAGPPVRRVVRPREAAPAEPAPEMSLADQNDSTPGNTP